MAVQLLARSGLDFGLGTDHEADQRAFYEALGLTYLQTDHIMDGQDEVYYTLHGGWLKFVTSDQEMRPGVSGYKELLIADSAVDRVERLEDPDGLLVTRVPPGALDVDDVGVRLSVPDVDAQIQFLEKGMGATRTGSGYRVGNTQFTVEEAPGAPDPGPAFARGFTMITLVVSDIYQAHERLVAAGGHHGLRVCPDPMVPGRCLFSFVSDPNGNWIELVQFADLSGPLPELRDPLPSGEEFLAFRDEGVPI
jgi:catechol 2,3-dioxygenase-like lactoylglutathione lyase family enzyme